MPYVKFGKLDNATSVLTCICQHWSLFLSVEITPTCLSLFVTENKQHDTG